MESVDVNKKGLFINLAFYSLKASCLPQKKDTKDFSLALVLFIFDIKKLNHCRHKAVANELNFFLFFHTCHLKRVVEWLYKSLKC